MCTSHTVMPNNSYVHFFFCGPTRDIKSSFASCQGCDSVLCPQFKSKIIEYVATIKTTLIAVCSFPQSHKLLSPWGCIHFREMTNWKSFTRLWQRQTNEWTEQESSWKILHTSRCHLGWGLELRAYRRLLHQRYWELYPECAVWCSRQISIFYLLSCLFL